MCVCVVPRQTIDVWVIPCIQLCKINTRIKHQMTEIYWAQRSPTFLHFCCSVSLILSHSALPCFFSTQYNSILLGLSSSHCSSSFLGQIFAPPFLSVSAAFLNHIQSEPQIPSHSWPWAQINLSSWWTDILPGWCFTCSKVKKDGRRSLTSSQSSIRPGFS